MVKRLYAAQGKRGEASEIVREYREMTGYSVQQIYRIARENGYRPRRKQRADAGECMLSESQVAWIAAQLHVTSREVKGAITPVEKAMMDAEDNGIIPRGCISVSRMQDILRERSLNKGGLDAPTPHIRMRSLHPNHVHILDASVCIQYYIKDRIRMMPETDLYKNKYKNFVKHKKKLIRYVLTDHFSGCIFLKYYHASGENQRDVFDFVTSAWNAGKHEKFPFRGVPFHLLIDAGAANISHAVTAFLEQMDVKIPKSLPHNPRRQGTAEVTQNLVERWFESGLRIQPATTVEQLNQWAMDWAVWFNATRTHTRTGMTRTGCWLSIRPEQLREMPDMELIRELFATPEKPCRVYGDYTIRFRGEVYPVGHIQGLMPGRSEVTAVMRPLTHPEILVRFKGEEYLVRPVGRVEGGFREGSAIIGEEYKAVPHSPVQNAKKIMENMAYGEERKKDQVPFAGTTVMGNKADKVAATPIPKKGVIHMAAVSAAEDIGGKQISLYEFITQRLKPALGGVVSPEINRAVSERYGSSISLTDAGRLADAARDGRLLAALAEEEHDSAQANFK